MYFNKLVYDYTILSCKCHKNDILPIKRDVGGGLWVGELIVKIYFINEW